MPLLYGERHGAFKRLQEEIVRSTYDLSLLAWAPPGSTIGDMCGFFSQSVENFSSCYTMYSVTGSLLDEAEMNITNKGLKLRAPEYILAFDDDTYQYALKLNCMIPGYEEDFLTIPMRKIGPNTFVRARSLDSTASFRPQPVFFGENELRTFILLTELPDNYIPGPLPRMGDKNIVSSCRFTEVQIKLPWQVPQNVTDESTLEVLGRTGLPLLRRPWFPS